MNCAGGTTTQIGPNHQRFQAYFPETGQAVYQCNRSHCGRRHKLAAASDFIAYAEKKILSASRWTPDAVCGAAERDPKWKNKVRVCTRALYHYIDRGLVKVTNLDLPSKLRYRSKKSGHRPNLKHLGDSIDNRSVQVQKRKQFGHWEIDTGVGKKSGEDDAPLTLVERKTRLTLSQKIDGKDPDSVGYAVKRLIDQLCPLFGRVFRIITAQWQQILRLDEQSEGSGHARHGTHPYASWERLTNEHHNGMIRKFIPKGQPIAKYSQTFIRQMIRTINHLPRRILNYRTPAEAFKRELQKLAS